MTEIQRIEGNILVFCCPLVETSQLTAWSAITFDLRKRFLFVFFFLRFQSSAATGHSHSDRVSVTPSGSEITVIIRLSSGWLLPLT